VSKEQVTVNSEQVTVNSEQITDNREQGAEDISTSHLLPITCSLLPVLYHETSDFAVVYKPPRMHCAPLKPGGGNTLLDWYAAVFPPVTELSGRKEGEGGLLHRLDFETQGLVLFAKNQKSLNHLLQQQDEGKFVKEYTATCQKAVSENPTFPPPSFNVAQNGFPQTPFVIESFFRAYGPGRKQVRPVTDAGYKHRKIASDEGGCYRTEIVSVSDGDCRYTLAVRLCRGFRHQIRCHLAWIGCPVLNDPLYGQDTGDGFLALRATGLAFTDPSSGLPKYITQRH
jgi:23S rRNA pseudouridine1911/1915/1917 synthase